MEIFLITSTVISTTLFCAALACAAYLYGNLKAGHRYILSQTRLRRQLLRELKVWQSHALHRTGIGSLRPTANQTDKAEKEKRIIPKYVAPNEAIAREREHRRANPTVTAVSVPPAVKENFMRDVSRVMGKETGAQ